jgi:hypothetical protein
MAKLRFMLWTRRTLIIKFHYWRKRSLLFCFVSCEGCRDASAGSVTSSGESILSVLSEWKRCLVYNTCVDVPCLIHTTSRILFAQFYLFASYSVSQFWPVRLF